MVEVGVLGSGLLPHSKVEKCTMANGGGMVAKWP
jgi:hypothetical protein